MSDPIPYTPTPGDSLSGRVVELARSFRFGLSYSWRVSRIRTAAVVVVPLAESLIPAALALVLRGLVNATLSTSTDGSGGTWSIEVYVLVSLLLSLALAVSQSLQLYLSQANTEALEHQMALDQIDKAGQLEFGYFEAPEFQDTLNQVRLTPGHHVHEMVAKCVRTVAMLITVSSLLIILATIEPLLLAFLVPLSVPYLAYRSWVAKRYEVRFAQNRSQRWIHYYTQQVMNAQVLPEVRALDLGPLFARRVAEGLATIRAENERSFRRELLGSSGFNSFAVFAIHVALLSSANRAADGSLTAGDIAIFAGAATGLRSAIDAFVAGIGSLRWHLAHLEHLRIFFALEPALPSTRGPAPVPHRGKVVATPGDPPPLALHDVTFTYPAVSAPVLNGLSLRVEAGETVGMVGRNGSGKSTIVKLINGLYAPDAGRIELGGIEVHDATSDYVRDHVSTVFQFFGHHSATRVENIAMGDWRRLLDDPPRVEEIARQVGLDDLIRSLPHGYETILGRAFGDVALSGGQWQTFAIARAFARATPLMILDEPTSSLDPEAEFEVFERFKELATGRATLLISHRFTTLALADRIIVLNNGRAEEQGTHDELIDLDGTYAHLHRLFRIQGETGVWSDESDQD